MAREISDEEYAYLQQRRQVADFVEPIYNHPVHGREAKRLIKKIYPQANIPDHELREEMDTRFAAEEERRKKEKDDAEQQQKDAAWKTQRAEAQKEYGLSDEFMEKLDKWMWDNNVANYKIAASHLVSQEPKPTEPTADSMYWHHDRQEGFQEIARDPEGWAHSQLVSAIRKDEQRAKQQR